MTIKRPGWEGLRRKRPFPLSILLTLFACALGAAAAALMNRGNLSMAFGDVLMIEALAMFGLAWVGYLKKDGVRFLSPRKISRENATESWKDRVPSLGDAPFPPHAIPSEKGPQNSEYQRLAAAEHELRKKIIGGNADNLDPSSEGKSANSPQFMYSAAIAAFMLFLLALGFEYIIPGLLRLR